MYRQTCFANERKIMKNKRKTNFRAENNEVKKNIFSVKFYLKGIVFCVYVNVDWEIIERCAENLFFYFSFVLV